MTNTLKLSFLSAAFIALTATSSFAQSTGRVSVKVPFEFTAGSVTLPAGDYTFQEDQAGVVTISCRGTLRSIMVLTSSETADTGTDQPRLKFDRVNGVYNLTEIEITGEPSRRIIKMETASNRPASLGNRASAAASSKSLK